MDEFADFFRTLQGLCRRFESTEVGQSGTVDRTLFELWLGGL